MQNLRQEEARKYNKIKRILSIIGIVINFVFLLILLLTKLTHLFRDISSSITQYEWLIIIIYLLIISIISEIISLPLSFYGGYIIEHKFKLSNQKIKEWIIDQIKEFAISIIFTLLVVEIIYLLLRRFPNSWWIICGVVFIFIMIALVNLAPILLFPIFFKFKPLENEELKNRLLKFTERTRVKIREIFECDLSKKTKKANAALAGLGNTRRIILGDNLLKNYSNDEIEVILAHELGHHTYNHLWKGIGLEIILTFSGFYLVDICLKHFSKYFELKSISDIAGFPFFILVLSVLGLLVMPLFNLYSRKLEIQADDYSVEITQKPESFISGMEKLAEQNLAELYPNKIIEFIFYSHPSVGRRIDRIKSCINKGG